MPNPNQIFLAKSYDDGAHAALADIVDQETFAMKLAGVDDAVFRALMAAVSDEAGCDSVEEARDRLQNASDNIDRVLQRLYETVPTLPQP